MDESLLTRAADDASPFRRFPWVQLAFCLACLAMTAWTWMRYSYAWEMSPGNVIGQGEGWWPDGAYARVRGRMTGVVGRYTFAEDDSGALELWPAHTGEETPRDAPRDSKALGDGPFIINEEKEVQLRPAKTFIGRIGVRAAPALVIVPDGLDAEALPDTQAFLDTTASRFPPASIAGIVVGAMGCFIFGLYLRAWLSERKAV